MNVRALMHILTAATMLLFALAAGAAEVIRFGYLELNKDPRYDEKKTFFRTLSRPFGQPFAGAEVALREARFVGQALGVSFELARARGADAAALVVRVHVELVELAARIVAHGVGEAGQSLVQARHPPGVMRIIELRADAAGSVAVGEHGVDLRLRDQRRIGGLPHRARQRSDGVDLGVGQARQGFKQLLIGPVLIIDLIQEVFFPAKHDRSP